MRFLAPSAFFLAALAGPLIALYMLRSRRRRVVMPSLLLWGEEPRSVSSARPWERLRPTPLLLLQLLVLALFVVAVARPFVREAALLGPHTVLVVDTSASMGQAGRLDDALDLARSLAGEATEQRLVSVVDGGPRPRVVAAFAADPDALRRALDDVVLTGGEDRLDEAVRLARGLATPDRPTHVLVLSDGGHQPLRGEPFPDVTHLEFAADAPNVGIALFAPSPDLRGQAVVDLVNVGEDPVERTVAVAVDGAEVTRASWSVPGLGRIRRTVPVDAAPGSVVTARLVGSPDGSALDDLAAFVVAGGGRIPVEVSGDASFFLQALLAAHPGVVVGGEGGLVRVANGGDAGPITTPSWLIRTDPPPGVTVEGVARNLVVGFQRPGEPILDGVDLSAVVVGEADIVTAPGWLVLASAGDVPLLLIGDVDGRRVAYQTFSLEQSNLPVEIAFPILGRNLIDWLTGGAGVGGAVDPVGTPIVVAGTGATVETPDGARVEVPAGIGAFEATLTPGIYRVVAPDGSVTAHARSVAPAEIEQDARTIASDPVATSDGAAVTAIREVVPWAVGSLLVFLLLEWWLGHVGPRRRVRREELAA